MGYQYEEDALAEVRRRLHLVPQPFGRYMSTSTGQYYTNRQLSSKYIEYVCGKYYIKNL